MLFAAPLEKSGTQISRTAFLAVDQLHGFRISHLMLKSRWFAKLKHMCSMKAREVKQQIS